MTPDEIKALRKELGCTARELAASIGVDQATVLAWEQSTLFPTKVFADRMRELQIKGPGAIVRKSKGSNTPAKVLAEPEVWAVLRKIVFHKPLREQVSKLAQGYPDPADE